MAMTSKINSNRATMTSGSANLNAEMDETLGPPLVSSFNRFMSSLGIDGH